MEGFPCIFSACRTSADVGCGTGALCLAGGHQVPSALSGNGGARGGCGRRDAQERPAESYQPLAVAIGVLHMQKAAL